MIRFAKAAQADLRRIDAWLRPRAGDAVTNRLMDAILSDIQILDRHPDIGRPGREPGTRELVSAAFLASPSTASAMGM